MTTPAAPVLADRTPAATAGGKLMHSVAPGVPDQLPGVDLRLLPQIVVDTT